METCNNCVFWTRCDDNDVKFRKVTKLQGRCNRAETDAEKPVITSTLFYAIDFGGYAAWLYTSENFGCIEFKAVSNG